MFGLGVVDALAKFSLARQKLINLHILKYYLLQIGRKILQKLII